MNTKKPIFNLLSLPSLLLLGSVVLLQISCSKKVEEFDTEPLSDYIPLQVGKYITYRVDSTVFTNFGTVEETHSYLMKHVIDSEIPDNLGRPSYRVFRYISNINDTTGTPDWIPTTTYFITSLSDQIEVIEDNLRFIKMHVPIKEGFTWKGNKYLFSGTCDGGAIGPYCPLYNFSNDDFLADWDFYFDSFESAVTYRGQTYSDVYTIEQFDEAFNVPITNPNAYASLSRGVEKYSKTIGLVYKEYALWEYQPNPGGSGPYKVGFGVKMWMVDHN